MPSTSTLPAAAATQTGSGALAVAGWVALAVALASALLICWDIFVRGHRQRMAVMDAVYPITALYVGPVAAWFHFRRGVRMSPRWAPALRSRQLADGPPTR